MSQNQTFKFNDKADYIYYLSEIMIDLFQRKEQIQIRLDKGKSLLEQNPKAKIIDSVLYESISDNVVRPLQYVFNLLGDESKKAVSYRKFRKMLLDNKKKLGIELDELSIEEKKILNEFGQLRNWSLHIPESIYIEKKKFFEMTSDAILKNQTEIVIPKYLHYEIRFLERFREETEDVLKEIDKIIDRMMKDYRALIGKDFKIVTRTQHYKPYAIMDIVSNSWDTQTGPQKKE